MTTANSPAADLTWTNGNDYWQSTTAWATNGTGGTGGFPSANDAAIFTNAATYSVTLSNDVTLTRMSFANGATTAARVTLDLGTHELSPTTGDTNGAFVVGDGATSTTIVYLATSGIPGKNLFVPNWILVGNNGIGTLFVTNGNVTARETFLGFGDGSRGTLVLSGPNTIWSNSDNICIGHSTNSSGSSLVISNSASLIMLGGLMVGDSTSNNTVLLDTGGKLITALKFSHLGQYKGDPSVPSYNNTVIVQGGASCDFQDHSLNIGSFGNGVATGNVLTVGVGGLVTNIATLRITARNGLNMAGGLYGGKNGLPGQTVGAIDCSGTVQGFGTMIANTTINSGGFFSPFNSLGQLTFSNSLTLASNSVTTVQLGTNFWTTVVVSNLTLAGTLNITDNGGLTTNTYPLFTYGGTLTNNGLTIGTAPAGYTYAINTNAIGQIKLVVGYPPPVAGFSGNPTNGEAPLAVTFTDSSSGVITNRFWNLGDGNTSNTTATSLSHSYSFAGTYTVSLTASGPGGTNTSNRSNYIVATNPPPPVAGFDVNTHGGLAPLAVTFTNTSTGNITNGFWDFGDSNTTNTTAASVSHTYTRGTYTVSLTANGLGGSNTKVGTNWITALDPAHVVVNPGSLNYGSVTIGQTNSLSFSVINTGDLSLTGTAASAAPFAVTSGGSYTVAGGQTQAVTVAFAPGVSGTFNGPVIFSSNGGDSTNAVSGAGLTPGSIAVTPATLDFGTLATGTTAQASFVVTNSGGTAVSNGTATVAGGPFTILSGATFNVPSFGSSNVVVRFAPVTEASFTNSALFATANGGNATNTVSGTGAIVPVAAFSATPTNGAAPLTVAFTDTSSGTITNRAWSFGDGATTNTLATSLSYTYTTAGTNTVSLTVTGPVGTSNQTRTNYIVVVNPPHLVVSPGNLGYGSVTIGQTNTLSFSLLNTGDLPLSGTATSATPFAVTSGGTYTVAAGASTNVVINFTPDAEGSFSANAIFTSSGGVSTNLLSGAGLTPGSIAVTPATLDFGTLATGTTTQASFVVTNSGGTAVSNGTATVAGGPFTILSGATFNVPGFGSTNVVVEFAPVSAGGFSNEASFATANGGDATNTVLGTGAIVPGASFSGSPTNGPWPLMVSFTDGSSGTITNRHWDFGDGATTNTLATSLSYTYTTAGTNTVSLTVTGPVGTSNQTQTNYIVVVNPPHLVVSPGSLNYGSVTIGQTNSLSFSVINTGDLSLTGTAASAAPFAVTSGGAYTVAGGQTQAVTVAFAPGVSGTFNGPVIFSSNGGDSTNAVSGAGLTPGSIAVTPATLDFGTLATGTTAQASFVVTNSGGTAVSNGTATVAGGPFTILSGATFNVPGFGSTNVTMQFAPVNPGAFTDSVIFATANGGNATNTVSGTGAIVPVAAFSATPTNGAAPLTVTFTDTSSGTITNRHWDFGDGNTTNTTATSFSHTYTARGSNTVGLTASGPVGSSTLTLGDYIVVVNPAHLAVNPGSLSYGSVTIGQTNSLSFSVINAGDVSLTGTVTSSAPFSVTSGTSYNVAGGQTGTVTIAFVPDAATTFNGSVIFASDGGNSTNAVTGIGLTPGSITVMPASQDFGTLVTGTTAQASFTVLNSGGTAVSNGTATVTGGPFTIVSGATVSLPGFGSTNVTIQFAPVSAGLFTNFVIFATANGGNATNTVSGTGAIVPVASFTGAPTNGTAPLVVAFTDSSTGTITNRHWDLGDGSATNTTATSLSHTYSAAGTNTVNLTISGPVGTDTLVLTNYVVVGVPPVADFSASPTNGVAPFTVNFTDASSGEITNRLWNFGDSGTSSATSPSHVYTNAGTYSISLTAFGPYGTNTKTQTNLIRVYATSATWTNANADGLWSDTSSWNPATVPDLGSSVVFADAGTTATVDNVSRTVGTITFQWSAAFFVDASGGASLTVSNGITVATNDTYTVYAPVVLGAGNTWSVANGGTLQIGGAISGANSITETGSGTVTLNGTNTYSGGTVVSSGTLLVNNTGGSGTGTGTVTVTGGATLGGCGVIGGPVVIADGGVFSPGSSDAGVGVGTLTVSNNLTFGNTSVLQYELGTNGDLTVVNGNLTLDGTLNLTDAGGFTNGTYTLFSYGGTLTTNGSAGILTIGTVADSNMIYAVDISSNGFVKLMVLFPPPVADFGAGQTVGMASFTVTFTDTSSGPITNRFWDFGDGTTSNTLATSVEHTYNAGGNNTVQLIVSGPGGVSTNTRADYVIVAPPCDYPLSGTNASFGVTGGSATVTVSPYTNVCAWTASSNGAWIQIDGGSITATGSAAVAYTVLSNTSSSNARTGTMTIAGQTFTVAQAGDTTSPTIALTGPAPGIVSNTIAVSATVTDDVAVVQVRFYRDGGVLLGTAGTPPHSVNFDTATVGDGSHCFYAMAYDAANNVSRSATNCVTVDNNAPSLPAGLGATAVATNQINLNWSASSDGGGSGVAGYKVFRDGAQIATTDGSSYSDVGLALGTTHCYRVAAYDNIGRVSAQTANACAQTFVMPGSLLGTYNGLAFQTNAPTYAGSGSIRIKLSRTGSFAANLSMGETKTAFKGRFDVSGNATSTVTRKKLSPLQVILHLDLSYGTDQITGTVSDGVFTSELLADRMVYGKTTPCPLAGSYTLVLTPSGSDPDIPQGYGYGRLLVATTGSARLSGTLADGTMLAGVVPVSKHGTGPLYDQLYKNHGACIGWVTFSATNHTLEATVDWFRPPTPTSAYYPAGFATNVALIGEIYVAPSAGGPSPAGDREITLGGGNLGSSIVETVSVDAAGNVAVPAPNSQRLTLKLTTQTGQFSGSFMHPALNKSLKFNALTLQSDGSGAGYFLGTNQSGYVIVEPVP